MGIDISNTVFGSTGTNLVALDSSGNKLFQQTTDGIILGPQTSGGDTYIPMFNVGWKTPSGWISLGTASTWTKQDFSLTTGPGGGYKNVGNCYNTSLYRFTVPWTGLYYFKSSVYIYAPLATFTGWARTSFAVNGGIAQRRAGSYPQPMSCYGIRSDYGMDIDICELIWLIAGDYVELYAYHTGSFEGHTDFSTWSGVYLGS